jgi:hypothetical protein
MQECGFHKNRATLMNSQLVTTFPRCYALRLTTLVLLAGLAMPTLAQQSGALNNCQNITDRAARFECYDKVESVPRSVAPAGATLSTIPATRPTAPTAATASASGTPQTAVVRETEKRQPFYKRILPFGLGDDDKESTAPAPAAASEVDTFGRADANSAPSQDDNRELVDTIAKLEETEPNTWKITLANGQVWQQATGKRYAMKDGDQVTIRKSGWGGSYRLYVERLGSYIQVDRVN